MTQDNKPHYIIEESTWPFPSGQETYTLITGQVWESDGIGPDSFTYRFSLRSVEKDKVIVDIRKTDRSDNTAEDAKMIFDPQTFIDMLAMLDMHERVAGEIYCTQTELLVVRHLCNALLYDDKDFLESSFLRHFLYRLKEAFNDADLNSYAGSTLVLAKQIAG